LEYRSDADDHPKETGKYMGAPGASNRLYFPPGLDPAWLTDNSIPVIFTEGEFKALALWRLAIHETDTPRFIPIGLTGVWNWRGTIGKAPDPRVTGATSKARCLISV
jgi:hypothetical protein